MPEYLAWILACIIVFLGMFMVLYLIGKDKIFELALIITFLILVILCRIVLIAVNIAP